MSAVECGAACLAMILSYFRAKSSVSEVRNRCQIGRDGLSALDLVKAARSYGLRVRADSLQGDDLRLIPLPGHCPLGVQPFSDRRAHLRPLGGGRGPGSGPPSHDLEEFFNGFTGIVLMLEPGVQYERATTRRAASPCAAMRART